MKVIGNIIWFLFGGFVSGLSWIIAGLICFITIIGIPLGIQCFKFANLSFFPFGKDIEYSDDIVSFTVNILWLLFFGIWMGIENIIIGLFWCITIVGIPFGKQFFKIAKLSFMPFGARIVEK